MSYSFTLSPPPPSSLAVVYGGSANPTGLIPQIPKQQTPNVGRSSSPNSSGASSSSILIVFMTIASTIIISASIYVLIRIIIRSFHRSVRTFSNADDVVSRTNSAGANSDRQCHVESNSLLDSLPLFTFRSITGNSLAGGDCAVCLSKFELNDQLRLLPLCCHAFHAECIDSWIVSNQTCPLCRSTVLPTDDDVLDKVLSAENRGTNINNSFGNGNGDSFRIEIGSVSVRRGGADSGEGARRSYSIGSFDYIVEDGYEVSLGSTTHHREVSDCTSVDKESSFSIPIPEPSGEFLTGDGAVGGSGRRNWLREYVDRLASVSFSSRSLSFRSSGRFFSGSSRRSNSVAPAEDLEAERVGEEISELFRWLSGV